MLNIFEILECEDLELLKNSCNALWIVVNIIMIVE